MQTLIAGTSTVRVSSNWVTGLGNVGNYSNLLKTYTAELLFLFIFLVIGNALEINSVHVMNYL